VSIVGLIPARAGSERIKDKNIRDLCGHPLLAYSIASALESDIFSQVIVSTDSDEYADVAHKYGVKAIKRPGEHATSTSPDIAWIQHALEVLHRSPSGRPDEFAILRPTSPFRSAETIRKAYGAWMLQRDGFDSLRAVQPVTEHAGKMWRVTAAGYLEPLLLQPEGVPFHSSQMASLPKLFVQNASLEIAHTKTALDGSIAGDRIMPFLTPGYEGFDINQELDFKMAELLVADGLAELPWVSS
jgi:CMP-N-acetylneuraminic acid synthetase